MTTDRGVSFDTFRYPQILEHKHVQAGYHNIDNAALLSSFE